MFVLPLVADEFTIGPNFGKVSSIFVQVLAGRGESHHFNFLYYITTCTIYAVLLTTPLKVF